MSKLKILEYVYSVLSENEDIVSIVGDSLYPITVPSTGEDNETKVPYPIIIYTRTSISPTYAKTCVTDEATVEMICWSKSYTESVNLIDLVRTAFENNSGEYEDLKVRTCYITDADEGYVYPAYYQRLILIFK
jgi:hypothetical protein